MYDDILVIDDGDISKVISGMPNDRGISLEVWESETLCRARTILPSTLDEWNKDRSKFHVICYAERNIIEVYSAFLEKHYFPPETSLNDEFILSWYRWQDLLFNIISVPIGRIDWCFEAAQKTNMRLANGVPTLIMQDDDVYALGTVRMKDIPGTKMVSFPLDTDQAYVLEPQHDTNSLVVGAIGTFSSAPTYPSTYVDDIMQQMKPDRRKK